MASLAADLSPTALRVLTARYLRRDESGQVIETPAELFDRVAAAVASAEARFGSAEDARRWTESFESLLATREFLPNSPALMNAGTPLGQLSACFVLPVEDSMEAIFDALKWMALLQRSGGGTGFSFSRLRPRGDVVRSTGGQASGPVSFMRVFDCATDSIKQGGRRRGASMGVLRVDHPDILEFIDAKLDGRVLANFNLSVGATDAFMAAAVENRPYDLVHPRDARQVGRLPARAVFDRIVHNAWASGDPGLLYLDAINRANPTPELGAIEATNPCGEVPLLPWESCVLGSVNLAAVVREGEAPEIDWPRLGRLVRAGVRFLDDVIEVTRDPLPQVAAMTRGNRKIGLGVMGFAECLIRLGIPYDSADAIVTAERLARVIASEAREASGELAAERGVFPNWSRSVYAATGERRRNATLLSIAPTGTISMIAGTTAGIEPLFGLAYRRRHALGGGELVELNAQLIRALAAAGVDAGPLREHVAKTGTLRDLPGVPGRLRRLFATAHEIPVLQHLAIQEAFQRHVDNAVSKTINLPAEARDDAVAEAYLEGWRLGLKGITVYRSGSKPGEVIVLGAGEEPAGRELFAKCDPDACRL